MSCSQQDQSDSYCLLNSILAFEESPERSSIVSEMGLERIKWNGLTWSSKKNQIMMKKEANRTLRESKNIT